MIGDVLTSSILFEAIKEKYPTAELHYLINSHTLPVVQNNPFIDKFILYTPEIEKSYLKLWYFIASIRKNKYDAIIDVYSKLSSNLMSLFSNAPIKISYYKKQSLFVYNHNIKRKKHKTADQGLEITNRLLLLKPLGIVKNSIKPKIYLTHQEISDSKTYLQHHTINFETPLFMISVLGSSNSKTYPLHYMAKVIDTIVKDTKGQILFNYIPSQSTEAKKVYDLCDIKTQKHIFFNVFGENLREFLAITKHCDALIGNEGGAINMAKALDIPTFSIFSPWINKVGWNMFEDGKKHVSAHLKDYKPELYEKPEKSLKGESTILYEAFKPELFLDGLKHFLKH